MALPNNAPLTFGHPFAAGDMPRYAGLRATVGGTPVAAQIDPKSHWPDGSVRYAVISLKTPTGAGSTAAVTLRPSGARRSPATTAAQRAQAAINAGLNVQVVFTGAFSTTVSVQTLLQAAVNAGTLDVWLHGDVCSEIRVQSWLSVHFGVTADVRIYDGGLVSVDLLFHNDRFEYTGGLMYMPPDYTYAADIRVNNSSVFTFPSQLHGQSQWWRKRVWTGTVPAVRPLFDFEYWQLDAHALPATDLALGDVSAPIASYVSELSGKTGPLKEASYNKYFPTTGGGTHRAMVPTQQCLYLASQHKDALWMTHVHGEAMMSVPHHYRHPTENRPISSRDYPTMYVNSDSHDNGSPDFGRLFTNSGGGVSNGWTPDDAHRPNGSYVAYLITGDRTMHDELVYDSYWASIVGDQYRQGEKAILTAAQARGFAWISRTRLYTRYVTHDKRVKTDLDYYANETWTDYHTRYKTATSLTGVEWGAIWCFNRGDRSYAPWQEDFIMQAMTWAASWGDATAANWVDLLTTWSVGRAAAEHLGFSPMWTAQYYYKWPGTWNEPFDTTNGITINPKTWAALQSEHLTDFGGSVPTDLEDRSTDGYTAHALAASADLWNLKRDIRSLRTHGFVAWRAWLRTTHFNPTAVQTNPAQMHTPILPDGTRLSFMNVVCQTSAGTLNGTAGIDQILLAYPGSTVNAAGGSNLIYVYDGANTLNGSPDGNDVIIGGKGVDIIAAGPGDNWIQCGYQGTTRIDFGAANTGADRIYNFSQSRGDRLNVLPSLTTTQANALIAAAVDVDGSAVLTLASGKQVTMVGHPKATMASSWFVTS